MNRFCLIGEHLSHSLSAVIHQRLFAMLGVEGSYDLREIPRDEAGRVVSRLADEGYDGFNVTIPYKEVVPPQLDGLSVEAAAIGAVNTVLLRPTCAAGPGAPCQRTGYNTDYAGFGRMLESARIDARGGTAAILGMGGAYRAAAAYLLDHGVELLYAVTRHPEREAGRQTNPRLRVVGYDALRGLSGALLVNATPVGMFPHAGVSPVGAEIISRFDAAADLIYNPKETEFLRLARQEGLAAVNGMTMLVAQAVAAEEIWLGRGIDAEITRRLAEEMAGYLEGNV